MVDKKRQTKCWDHKELGTKCVVLSVVCCPEFRVDQKDCYVRCRDEDHLHNRVVSRDVDHKKVKVSRRKDQSKQDL